MSKNIIVIGGGPGGYTCAIRLSELGAKVTLIEKDSLGGTCLNRGCIPTKAMVKSAEVFNTVKNAESFGISVAAPELNLEKIIDRKNNIVSDLNKGIEFLMRKNKIEHITGHAKLIDKNTVEISTTKEDIPTKLHADNIVIATGSRPFIPPIPGIDSSQILTSDSILDLTTLPQNLTIIGGGVIGMEFASIFNALGSKVTVIEMADSILGYIEPDIAKRALPLFKRKGIDIHLKSAVKSIERNIENFNISFDTPKESQQLTNQKILIATGRTSYTENLGLDELGIKTQNNFICIDNHCKTSIDTIYAIGDVTGGWMLAHTASNMAYHVAEQILEHPCPTPLDSIVPSCIFTFPEIASAGLSELEAKKNQVPVKTGKYMFSGNGKAKCIGETDGFVKVISREDTSEIIGLHIMGPHASDLIQEGVIAIQKGLTTTDLKHIIHPHPTLSEAIHEAL